MSSLSIPRPRKMSDVQFIGDLTKLLERRKIKCGDPLSLDSFGSELSSNSILRSDLFTLCTAISHMGEEDLTGEELLVLVGRAVGGAQVCRGDGAVEIPEGMRSEFLGGYEAWSNRGSELHEPLPWPPPRPQIARSEPSSDALQVEPTAVSIPIAVKSAGTGLHSIQEALEIAKKRSPNGLTPPRSSAIPGTNVEGLTISELKALLADIESRMSRIQPHLSHLNSVVDPVAIDADRRQRPDAHGHVAPLRPVAPAAESFALPSAKLPPSVAASLAMIANPELAAVLPPPPLHVSEDKFLDRHPYMKPSRRTVPDLPIAILPVTPIDPPAVASVPAAPQVFTPSAATTAALAACSAFVPPIVPIARPSDPSAILPAVIPNEVVADPASAGLAAPQPVTISAPVAPAAVPEVNGFPVTGLNPIGAALVYAYDGLRANPRLMIAVAAVLLLFPTAFAGAFVYHYLHPRTVIKYADRPPVAATPESPADPLVEVAPATPNAATKVAIGSASKDTHAFSRPGATVARSATSHSVNARMPQAYVWPPPPNAVSSGEMSAPARPLVASATSGPESDSTPRPALRVAGPPASAIYVPSSTMIKNAISAPRPLYPADHAHGTDGTVVLQITISKQGDVTSTRTVSGPVELRAAAVQAVRTWRFRPYLLSGNPVDVETTMELPFKPQ
jgi:TonB family protein